MRRRAKVHEAHVGGQTASTGDIAVVGILVAVVSTVRIQVRWVRVFLAGHGVPWLSSKRDRDRGQTSSDAIYVAEQGQSQIEYQTKLVVWNRANGSIECDTTRSTWWFGVKHEARECSHIASSSATSI